MDFVGRELEVIDVLCVHLVNALLWKMRCFGPQWLLCDVDFFKCFSIHANGIFTTSFSAAHDSSGNCAVDLVFAQPE